MIFQAPILALLLVSALSGATLLWAAGFGVRVLRQWDLESGSRAQLELERRTHLVSTLLAFVMAVELFALLLFVFNADRMAVMFVGAMCAVGTLNVNAWGFPALYLKIAVFFAASLWLIVDAADSRGRDYPMIRFKYGLVILIAPLVLAAGAAELAYFLGLKADVITSCCSKLFTPQKAGLAAEMSGFDEKAALMLLGGAFAALALAAALWWKSRRFAALYSIASAFLFVAGLTAIVSTVSLYVYEHPNHHCPFCLLKAEYGYYGYLLYVPLFAATAMGIAPGVLSLYEKTESLALAIPGLMRRLVAGSLALYAVFGVVVIATIATSRLVLFG
ncbi:MAG: hypothetical protein R3D02_14710 [Hyphomicrobiales bacterium]